MMIMANINVCLLENEPSLSGANSNINNNTSLRNLYTVPYKYTCIQSIYVCFTHVLTIYVTRSEIQIKRWAICTALLQYNQLSVIFRKRIEFVFIQFTNE